MGIPENIKINEPLWLLLVFALVILLPALKRLGNAVAHTFTDMHKLPSMGWVSIVCRMLFAGAWISMCIAAAGVEMAVEEKQDLFLARDTIIGLDRSSSMWGVIVDQEQLKIVQEFEAQEKLAQDEMRARYPDLFPPDQPLIDAPEEPKTEEKKKEEPKGPTRFQMARYAAVQFLKSRPKGDRSGMFTFDDEPYWVWPLGADLNVVTNRISTLSKKEGGGTNFEGPTESDEKIGAFQACINHFNKLAQAKTRVMILISDGEAGISPERREALRAQMQKPGQEIHIFCLVVAEKERMDNSDTNSLKEFTKSVNPPGFPDSVIWAGDGKAMTEAFENINKLERSTVKSEPVLRFHDVSNYLVAASCVLLGLFIACAALFREDF